MDSGEKITNGRASAPPKPRQLSSWDLRMQGRWKSDQLFFKGELVASIVQDQKYPVMWRVLLPDGELSDMVNRVRAKEAAYALAAWAANA